MRIATVACIFLSLCGCIPVLPHEYYLPAAAGGVVMVNHCWRTRESIQVSQPGVLAEVQVMMRERQRFLEIRWELQPGETLELTQSTARFYVDDPEQSLQIAMQQSLYGAASDLQPVRPMVGSYLSPPVETSLRSFWTYVALPASLPDSFRVLIATYSIDGRTGSLPELRFTKESSVQFLAPIQC